MRKICLLVTVVVGLGAQAQDFEFDATHRNMFEFVEKDERLQQYGYSGFCKNTKSIACIADRLSYRKYLGKRGYFLSMEPVAKRSGFEFREVILETGEKYFFVAKPHKGDILGAANSEIAFVDELNSTQAEVGKPFVEGSSVKIIRAKVSYGKSVFYINDEEPFDTDELKIARGILNSLSTRDHDKELLETLQVSSIDWDRIEQRYIIRIAPFFVDRDAGPVRATVIKTGDSVSLRGTIRYSSDSWLFVNRYVVVAGATRYESPAIEFRRDNSGGSIWEWTSFPVDTEKRKILDAVAAESDAVVRFYGRDYYNDKELSDLQRDGLYKMLRLYDLLSQYSK